MMCEFGVVVASSTGHVKAFDFSSKSPINLCSLGSKKISTISWDTSAGSVLLGTKEGSIVRQDLNSAADIVEHNFTDGSVVSLLPINQHVVSVYSDGVIKCLNGETLQQESEIKTPGNLCCGRTLGSLVAAGGRECNLHVWDLNQPENPVFTAKNLRPTTLQLEVPVWISDVCFVPQYDGRILLTASRIGELCLYDIRCGQRRPVSRHAWRLSRKYGKIKVGKYAHGAVLPDLSVIRPITKALAFDDAPGTGIRVVAGNAIGDLCFLDMRLPRERVVQSNENELTTVGRVKSCGSRAAEPPVSVRTLAGASGSITALACGGCSTANFPLARQSAIMNNENVLIASSLDRYLRLYNRETGVRLAKLYAKVPITSFLVSDSASLEKLSSISPDSDRQLTSEETDKKQETSNSESEDSEIDELFDLMEPVDEQEEKYVRKGLPKNGKRRRRK
ncbi:WD repeat-containing protein 74 [Fasciola gigantica]|uniref:WD repeat-containing protein 74 n=1 Tax=Fasciola gigantica TaxID=46835 RepID=A0A504YY40_FASGI|nr:WD repeat-containing protein 74 [Fasciola gigantica]